MGCDIHTYAERKSGDAYELIKDFHPFDWRSYGMYGWLADVRNYSDVPHIAAGRGVPNDAGTATFDAYDEWKEDAHNASWVSVEELAEFDYDQQVEDRRVRVQLADNLWSGAGTAAPGGGQTMTYREFLGESFFDDLEKLKEAGADRVVFWFDN